MHFRSTHIILFVFTLSFLVVLAGLWYVYYHEVNKSRITSLLTDTTVDPNHPSLATTNLGEVFPPRRTYTVWDDVPDPGSVDRSVWRHVPDQAKFVMLSQDFNQLLLNTPLEIHIPQTKETHSAIVDRIVPTAFGATTVYAKPKEGETVLERLILTYNEVDTMAYVSTTQGNWELKGDGKIAWIVSTQDLKRNQDYSRPDILNEPEFRYAGAEYVPRREPK